MGIGSTCYRCCGSSPSTRNSAGNRHRDSGRTDPNLGHYWPFPTTDRRLAEPVLHWQWCSRTQARPALVSIWIDDGSSGSSPNVSQSRRAESGASGHQRGKRIVLTRCGRASEICPAGAEPIVKTDYVAADASAVTAIINGEDKLLPDNTTIGSEEVAVIQIFSKIRTTYKRKIKARGSGRLCGLRNVGNSIPLPKLTQNQP